MKTTKYNSYCLNGITEGCRECVKGEKLVLFMTGKCLRNCYYCSLSNKRKKEKNIYANERQIENIKDLIEEAKESNAKGAGITGGDLLLSLNLTLKYARILKQKFETKKKNKKFHIHIYLPTKLVTKEKLRKLSKYIDEIRFHPEFLAKKQNDEEKKKDIEKIKLASLFWKKENIGCEFPILPNKRREIFEFILKIKNYVGFVNLNEFELSEINFNYVTKKYKLNKDTYTIADSIKAGLWILKQAEKQKLKIKVHVCSAKTKNWHQFKNRLLRHKIFPYGFKTKEGSVVYFVICNNIKKIERTKKELKRKHLGFYFDKKNKRLILSEKAANFLYNNEVKIIKIEEFPTYDSTLIESGEI